MKKSSMEQKIYNVLKQAILKRQIKPGSQLLENVISDRLQVSRTPIRAALRSLAQEGLVDLIANRGAFVIQPTPEEIKQAYQMRCKLEQIGLEMGAPHLTEGDFLQLAAACEDELSALEKGDIDAYIKANKAFHMAIIRKSGNQFLVDITEKMIDKTDVFLILYDLFYDSEYNALTDPVPESTQQHHEIIALLRVNDIMRASVLLGAHILQVIDVLETTRPSYMGLDDILRL